MKNLNVDEVLLEAIFRDQFPRKEGVHITQIVSPCKRKGWYEYRLGQFGSAQDAVTLWFGRQIHKTPLLPKHEYQLEWEQIHTSLDEYDPEKNALIEKKSIKTLKSKRYLPNRKDIYQVNCHNTMLIKTGHNPLEEAYILYISKEFPHDRYAYQLQEKDWESTEAMAEKMLEARDQLLSETIPDRNAGWSCEYCSYVPLCYSQTPSDFTKLIPIMRSKK